MSQFDNKDNNRIWFILMIFGLAGIVFMALVSLSGGTFFDNQHNALNYFVTFGISLLVSGACFCTGALTGFLFGIPRIINSTSTQKTRGTVLQNDNLVQISDWLTKIIVGVGLTQIYEIPGFLARTGAFLAPCFDKGPTGAAIAICLVLYFLILGFIACYLWTRFYFSEMLQDTIDDEPMNTPIDNSMNVNNMTITPAADPGTATPSSSDAQPTVNDASADVSQPTDADPATDNPDFSASTDSGSSSAGTNASTPSNTDPAAGTPVDVDPTDPVPNPDPDPNPAS